MTGEELMRLSAKKALREMSWDSIEFLFRPVDGVELLLRLDFEGTKRKIYDWMADDSPDAMPHRFRPPVKHKLFGMIKREGFYREIAALQAALPAAVDCPADRRRDDIFKEMFG